MREKNRAPSIILIMFLLKGHGSAVCLLGLGVKIP